MSHIAKITPSFMRVKSKGGYFYYGGIRNVGNCIFKECQALLTAEVKGKVNANVKDDELLIRIEFDGTWFEYKIKDFTKRAIYGMTAQAVTYEVVGKYRKFLINRMNKKYFKN